MKYILVLFILIFCSAIGYSQETVSSFLKNVCYFQTDGSGKSLGLEIKFKIPCSWSKEDGSRPHVVKKFGYSFDTGGTLVQTLVVNQFPEIPSKTEVADLFSDDGLKDLSKDLGIFKSGRRLIIDGLDAGEVVVKNTRESPLGTFYIYNIQYFIVYKDKFINLGFMAGANTESKAKELYDEYSIVFKSIANSTVLLTKWK